MVGGNVRKLPFPLYYSESPLVTGGDLENPENQTIIWGDIPNDEKMLIGLYLSLDELIAIASAIDVGRDIAYGENSIELWKIWTGALRMDICQIIANCLTDANSPAYQALNNAINQGIEESVIGTPENPAKWEENPLLIEPIGGCNEANLFGAIRGMLVFIDGLIQDLFQKVELSSNSAERVELILSGIPVIGALPADEAFGFANQIQEELTENYLAYYTQMLQDEIACELFCQLKDTCELDFQTLTDYFGAKFGQSMSVQTFEEAINWLIGASLVGDEVVYATHYLVMQTFSFGASWLGSNFEYFKRTVLALWNNPDSDYLLLCTDCVVPTFTHVFDFTVNNGGWRPFINDNQRATYVAGEGWRRGNTFTNRLQIETVGLYSFKMLSIQVELDETWVMQTGAVAGFEGSYGTIYTFPNTVPLIWGASGENQLTNERIVLIMANATMTGTNQPFSATLAVKRITITGEGADPF